MTGKLVTIIKDGKIINIEEDNLHKDDLVLLQTADIVPADLKLIETNGLEIDEFDITGEVLPVFKDIEKEANAYMGSRVIKGTGKGIVVAIKEQTEYGRIIHQNLVENQSNTSIFFDKKIPGSHYIAPASSYYPDGTNKSSCPHNPLLCIAGDYFHHSTK